MKDINYTEPAVLRGVWVAVLGLLASLGVVVSEDINGAVEGLIVAFATVAPLIQAWWTRRNVVSPATHAQALGRAASGLGNGPR